MPKEGWWVCQKRMNFFFEHVQEEWWVCQEMMIIPLYMLREEMVIY
jgi:hypothetical protein